MRSKNKRGISRRQHTRSDFREKIFRTSPCHAEPSLSFLTKSRNLIIRDLRLRSASQVEENSAQPTFFARCADATPKKLVRNVCLLQAGRPFCEKHDDLLKNLSLKCPNSSPLLFEETSEVLSQHRLFCCKSSSQVRAAELKAVAVEGLIVKGSGLPATKDNADPFEGEGA